MDSKVFYSPIALRDINRVWEDVFETSKNPDIASKYVEELLEKIDNKKEFPKSGAPLYYGDLFTGYYFVAFKAYIAFYRVDDDTIYVDRVLLGKSNYLSSLVF